MAYTSPKIGAVVNPPKKKKKLRPKLHPPRGKRILGRPGLKKRPPRAKKSPPRPKKPMKIRRPKPKKLKAPKRVKVKNGYKTPLKIYNASKRKKK